jgi:hypothetical protein
MGPFTVTLRAFPKNSGIYTSVNITLHKHYLLRHTSSSNNTDTRSHLARCGLATFFPNGPPRMIGGRLRCVKVLEKGSVVARTAGDVQMPIPST